MADDSWLLVFWTVLAVLFGIFALWKYLKPRNVNLQRLSNSQAFENVKKARLKYFTSREEVVSSNADVLADGFAPEITKQDNVFEKEKSQEDREEREPESVDARPVNEALEPPVRYTRSIEGPRKMSSAAGEHENSGFDPETSAPITRPLKTLEDVLSWRQGFDFFNVASVVLTEQCRKLEKRPRTLVCHDMKGGYLEDRFVQGTSSLDCYIIYHWQLIDIFVYFSHHFVTIPPPCWTNAAHTHGVPVLGTVITEADDGVARCSTFLEDSASWQNLANQLVDIAEYYRFDGWLINIENPIQPVQVNNLEEFVKYLTEEMHQRIPNSLIIWYDSVTYKGDLAWQDELNAKNRIFFDASDGIFLNYNWTEAHLMRSVGAAGRDRQTDVYVGVDVFGRGCFGGGGYNSKLAFKVIREEKLSVALFAPGWVMETQGTKNFTVNQDKFWNLLAPYCTVHAATRMMPFVKSLCRGCGKTASIDGKVVLSKPWTNLSAQQCQPSFNNTFFNLGTKESLVISSVEYTMDEAYNGGGCLLITGNVKSSQEVAKSVVRLFKADLHITGPVLLSFTFKLHPEDCIDVALQLHTDKMPTYLLLCPVMSDDQGSSNTKDSDLVDKLVRRYGIPKSRTLTSSAFMSPIGPEHYELFEPLTGVSHNTVKQVHGLREEDGVAAWCTRHYLIAEKQLVGCTVQEIRLICAVSPGAESTGAFKLYVGEIKVVDPQVLKQPLASARNIRCLDLVWKSTDQEYLLSLTLMWNCPISEGQVDEPAHYNIFRVTQDSNMFLGRAFVEAYRVCQIPVSKSCSSVQFIVQIVTRSGLKKPLNECSVFKLNW